MNPTPLSRRVSRAGSRCPLPPALGVADRHRGTVQVSELERIATVCGLPGEIVDTDGALFAGKAKLRLPGTVGGERGSSFGQLLVPFPIGISDQVRLSNRECRTWSMVHEHYKVRSEPSILRTVLEMEVECKVLRSSADHIYRDLRRRREAPASAFQSCGSGLLCVRIIDDPNVVAERDSGFCVHPLILPCVPWPSLRQFAGKAAVIRGTQRRFYGPIGNTVRVSSGGIRGSIDLFDDPPWTSSPVADRHLERRSAIATSGLCLLGAVGVAISTTLPWFGLDESLGVGFLRLQDQMSALSRYLQPAQFGSLSPGTQAWGF